MEDENMFFSKYRAVISRLFGAFLLLLILCSHRCLEDASAVADILFFAGAVMAGIATIGRLWCSMYISGYKDNCLIQSGPYSICRHPLYFFSLLGAVGLGMATETVTVPAIIILGFVLYYPQVINYEETNLRRTHGKEFEDYCQRTPMFFPSFSLLQEPKEYVVNIDLFRTPLRNSLWFIWGLGLLELVEALQEVKVLPSLLNLY